MHALRRRTLGLAWLTLVGACGGVPPGRVYRLPVACMDAQDTDEVRRCAGRLLDAAMVEHMGLYADDELHAYVRRVALSVAAPTGLPRDSWTFRVLDDPQVGAWAAPDAHIYVTRGLLAALDDEAELAAVLAHEVGHVVAGHTDMALDRLPELASGDWSDEFRLSRDDEAQADQLAVRYLRAAGYDPRAIRSALRTIYRFDDGDAGYSRRHPPLPVRLALTARAADGVSRGRRRRGRYLRHLRGLVVGPDPRRGRLEGSRYVHERGGFSFALPEGFRPWPFDDRRRRKFYAEGPDAQLMIASFHVPRGRESMVTVAARVGMEREGMRRFRLAGYEALEGRWRDSTDSGSVRGEPRLARLVVFEGRGHGTFALMVSAPIGGDAPLDSVFRRLVASVRREAQRSAPLRLRVRRFVGATTLQAAMAEGCAVAGQDQLIARLNGFEEGQALDAERSWKCVE